MKWKIAIKYCKNEFKRENKRFPQLTFISFPHLSIISNQACHKNTEKWYNHSYMIYTKTWLIVAFAKFISRLSFAATLHDTWCCHFMLLISIFTFKGIICSFFSAPPSVFTVASYNKNIIISSIFTLLSLFPFNVFDSLIITFV